MFNTFWRPAAHTSSFLTLSQFFFLPSSFRFFSFPPLNTLPATTSPAPHVQAHFRPPKGQRSRTTAARKESAHINAHARTHTIAALYTQKRQATRLVLSSSQLLLSVCLTYVSGFKCLRLLYRYGLKANLYEIVNTPEKIRLSVVRHMCPVCALDPTTSACSPAFALVSDCTKPA